MKVNINGVWKDSTPHVNVNGAWKPVARGYVNVNGAWKEFYRAFTHTLYAQYLIPNSIKYVGAQVTPNTTHVGDIQPRTAGPNTLFMVRFYNAVTNNPPNRDALSITVAYTGVRRKVVVTLADGRVFNVPWKGDYPQATTPYTLYDVTIPGVLGVARSWVGQAVPISIDIT